MRSFVMCISNWNWIFGFCGTLKRSVAQGTENAVEYYIQCFLDGVYIYVDNRIRWKYALTWRISICFETERDSQPTSKAPPHRIRDAAVASEILVGI